MSFFAVKITQLLEKNRALGRGPTNQRELARLSGLSESFIGKLARALQKSITPEDLTKIAINITTDQTDRAELIAAHLKDERHGPGSELVEIRIADQPAEVRETSEAPLPAKLERDFRILRAHSDNQALRTILDGLADLLDDEPAAGEATDDASEPAPVPRKPKGPVSYLKSGSSARKRMAQSVKSTVATVKPPPSGGKTATK